MDGTVLVADDDRTIRTVLTQALTRSGCRVHATSSVATLMRWIEEGRGDLVITDVIMPDGNGLDALKEIADRRPGLPVIVISAKSTIRTAIEAAEREAYDYLPKPFDLPELMARSTRALVARRRIPTQEENTESDAIHGQYDDLPLIGRSKAMQALYRRVARVTGTSLSVLVTGESGTGKRLVARAIHDYSDRRAHPFIVAAQSDFIDANGPESLFQRAGSGTVLLDKVSDLDSEAQIRLVRALDALTGDSVRVIATSQTNLTPGPDLSGFRQDLYYRISGVAIAIPPLRERLDDIPLLARHFVANVTRDGSPSRHITPEALETLRSYSWPGNVRQLENAVRYLAVAHLGAQITGQEVEAVLEGQPGMDAQRGGESEGLGSMVARHLHRHFGLHSGQLPQSGLHRRIMREVERPLIEITLDATRGNQAKCAEVLGMNRNTLRKKIADLDIRVTRGRRLL